MTAAAYINISQNQFLAQCGKPAHMSPVGFVRRMKEHEI